MLKIEIARKSNVEIAIFGIVLLVILFLTSLALANGDESLRIVCVVLIILIVFATFKILPNIPFKRHETLGYVNIDNKCLFIEKHGRNNSLNISKLLNLKVKLIGYDGQPRVGDMAAVAYSNETERMKPMNGLGNRISYTYNSEKHSIELYLAKEKEYNELKNIFKQWEEMNPSMKLKILR